MERTPKGEKTEGLSYTYGQKNVANVVQIMGKKMSWLRFKWHERHRANDEEIMVIHNIDANKMECHACGLKGHKINKCQTKYLHDLNLYKRLRSKLEIQEEMQQYENIKTIKVRHDRCGYKIKTRQLNVTQHKKRQKYSAKLHAEIYQNRYAELNEGRNKNIKENISCGESKRNETNN